MWKPFLAFWLFSNGLQAEFSPRGLVWPLWIIIRLWNMLQVKRVRSSKRLPNTKPLFLWFLNGIKKISRPGVALGGASEFRFFHELHLRQGLPNHVWAAPRGSAINGSLTDGDFQSSLDKLYLLSLFFLFLFVSFCLSLQHTLTHTPPPPHLFIK